MFHARKWTAIVGALTLISLAACSGDDSMTDESSLSGTDADQQTTQDEQMPSERESGADRAGMSDSAGAVARLEPTSGNQARGTVSFRETDGGIRVEARLTGLSPGPHGFHVHAKGDCSAPDATSAGGHYNPEDVEHGAPDDSTHHVGDLGNIEADDTGRAMLDREFRSLSLSGENGIVGKAVIVHSGEDDLQSQPTGDAGARVACGVIRSEGP